MADQHDQAVDEEQSNFPGINKRHGFFKAIERNQRDRDHYHQEWEEWREGRKGEVKREWRGTKRKPQKPLYCPPHTRERRPAALYRLEIEVRPNVWHRQTVHKVGRAEQLAGEIDDRYHLSEPQRKAIEDMIREFEESLSV